MMRIVNVMHGSYYLLGGYVALTFLWRAGYFVLAILAAALVIAMIASANGTRSSNVSPPRNSARC